MTQKIFEGLSHDWKWASWDRSGCAAVHRAEPTFPSGYLYCSLDVCWRKDFDRPVPPEGNNPEVLERVIPEGEVPPVPTNGFAVPLHLQKPAPVPQPDVRLFNQDVFDEDLSNGKLCNYAALNASGVVWLFEIMPTQYGQDFMAPGYSQKVDGKYKAPRAGKGQSVMLQKDIGEVPIICSQPVVPQPPTPLGHATFKGSEKPARECQAATPAHPYDAEITYYANDYRLVGSRVTCQPPPLDTDQDVLMLVRDGCMAGAVRLFTEKGYELEGSLPADMQTPIGGAEVFASLRKGDMNFIITEDPDFYKRFSAATELAKRMNLKLKEERVRLFQAVLYGNVV